MTDTSTTTTSGLLSGKAYDILKLLVTIWIPGFATLYYSLAAVWGLPAADEVVATAAAIATFLGLGLKVSSSRYYNSDEPYDGALNVFQNEDGKKVIELDVGVDLDTIENLGSLKFKVQ